MIVHLPPKPFFLSPQRSRVSPSTRETPKEHNARRFEQDESVEHRRLIFDVEEVVFKSCYDTTRLSTAPRRRSSSSRATALAIWLVEAPPSRMTNSVASV